MFISRALGDPGLGKVNYGFEWAVLMLPNKPRLPRDHICRARALGAEGVGIGMKEVCLART